MFLDKEKSGDSGLIAEEILADVPEVFRKCHVAEMAIKDGDFPMEEALKIYGITRRQYENYLKEKETEKVKQKFADLFNEIKTNLKYIDAKVLTEILKSVSDIRKFKRNKV